MTVAVQTNRNVYNGDGVTLAFNFNFYCVDPTWVHVTVGGIPATHIANIVLNNDQSISPGGVVNFAPGFPPPAGTGNVIIQRATPLTQLFNYQYLDSFPAVSHMGALDKATAALQDLAYQLSLVALPMPYIPGEFLTNDGTNLFWAPAGGGGGGGISVIGPTTTPTANAAIISGLSNNVLQLAAGDATHPGILSVDAQDIGGRKRFPAGAVTSVFDISNAPFNAVSAADTTTAALAVNDCAAAIDAAIAAATQVATNTQFRASGPAPEVYIPTGNWYISKPILLVPNTKIYGDGPQYSNIIVGPGTPATPSLVQGFAGPMFYLGGFQSPVSAGNGLPSYTSRLVGPSGRAMVMTTFNPSASPIVYPPTILLDDSWAWSTFLMWHAAQLSLQCWVEASAWGDGTGRAIIGSNGGAVNPNAQAIRLYATSNGTQIIFNAVLTTAVTGTQTIIAAPTTAGVPHYLEIDYDGAHFDFSVDGVNQGHVAMTGRVLKTPLDCSSLGDAGTELSGFTQYQITGAIDSIRLSNIARHTGTGSFTPPTTKHTWDANTLWLCNFDQPDGSTTWPFFQAQTVVSTITNFFPNPPSPTTAAATPGPIGGPNPHYCRFSGWTFLYMQFGGAANSVVEDLQLMGNLSTSGLIVTGASGVHLNRVWTAYTCAFGQALVDPFSFYSGMSKCAALFGVQVGTYFLPEIGADNIFTRGCGVGQGVLGGQYFGGQDSPGWNVFLSFVWGGLGGLFSPLTVTQCSTDTEGSFPYMISTAFVYGDSQMTFMGNSWQGSAITAGDSAVLYAGGATEGGVTHINDAFFPPTGGVSISTLNKRPFLGGPTTPGILALGCLFFNRTVTPVSDIDGLVAEIFPGQQSNQKSISTTATKGNNLAGTFTIQFGYSSGGPTFSVPEPDGRYIVNITYVGHEGSAPAAGSTVPGPYTTSAEGFTMNQGVVQTGTCTTIWAYTIIRTPGDALAEVYLPAIPSTPANPFVTAEPTGYPFYVGVTLVPATGHTIRANSTLGTQVIAEAGTPTTNWWQSRIVGGVTLGYDIGSTASGPGADSFVSGGKLYGVMNPGTHNVIVGISNIVPGLEGLGVAALYVDGALNSFFYGMGQSAGTQQTPIHLGEHAGGTETLTCATLRHFRADTSFSQVYFREQDYGVQAGQTEAAFFGDGWTLGLGAGAANLGSFATQVAQNRYGGGIYYWLAAGRASTMLGDVLTSFWQQWGAFQTFDGICLLAGFNDLLAGASAASIWAGMQLMLNGTQATARFVPPTSNAQAQAHLYYPATSWAGTPTFTIQGVVFNFPFITDAQTSVTTLANLINATAPTNTLVHATPILGGSQWICHLDSLLPGDQGNATTVSATGGAAIYNFGGTGTLGGGGNATITIQGVTFPVYFNIDADTTINNLITLINASAPTLALVTPTLNSSQLLLTAVNAGQVGNAIAASSNGAFGAAFLNPTLASGFLAGGADGAVQKGINPIVLCTVPPFGQAPGYTAGKDTQRNTLNASIRGFVAAGVTIADVDVTVRDGGAHQNVNPAYLAADNINLNDAGHAAVYAVINPLLP